MPERIQLSRAKGWRMPPNTVNVARGPGRRWGNPWKIGDQMYEPGVGFRRVETVEDAVAAFRRFVDWDPDATMIHHTEDSVWEITGGYGPMHKNRKTIRAELAGKNLACWCKLGAPCHADVLLELVNAAPQEQKP